MSHEVKRPVRVGERMRDELALLLSRVVKDPRVGGVIVTGVELTSDLRLAKVAFRLLEGGDEARIREAEVGLKSAHAVLRRELTQRMGLRFAPELRFRYDEGQDARTRIEELLEEIRRDGSDS